MSIDPKMLKILAEREEMLAAIREERAATQRALDLGREACDAWEAEKAEMLAVLRVVEWCDTLDGMRVCPACGGVHPKDWDRSVGGAPSYRGRERGHSPDCRLAALLLGDGS